MAICQQLSTNKKCHLEDSIPLDTPFTVMISPTDFCNMHCIFCEYHGNISHNESLSEKSFMDISLLKKLLTICPNFLKK